MNGVRTATVMVLAVAAGGAAALHSNAASGELSGTDRAAPPAYAKAPTVSCLRGKRVVVSSVVPTNRRFRALRDLAQRTSWQARLGRNVVAVSINRSADDAAFLKDLLRVPKDPLRLERKGNAVLLYAPASSKLAGLVRTCLA